jgi:hypothetical protein
MKKQLIMALAACSLIACDASAFARGPERNGRNSSRANGKSVGGQRVKQALSQKKNATPSSDVRREEPAPLK